MNATFRVPDTFRTVMNAIFGVPDVFPTVMNAIFRVPIGFQPVMNLIAQRWIGFPTLRKTTWEQRVAVQTGFNDDLRASIAFPTVSTTMF